MASPPNNPPLTFNVPMALTWARIAMIPVIIGVFYVPDAWYPEHWKNATACWLFVLAAVTDAFDGYIARRYGMRKAELPGLGMVVTLPLIKGRVTSKQRAQCSWQRFARGRPRRRHESADSAASGARRLSIRTLVPMAVLP